MPYAVHQGFNLLLGNSDANLLLLCFAVIEAADSLAINGRKHLYCLNFFSGETDVKL